MSFSIPRPNPRMPAWLKALGLRWVDKNYIRADWVQITWGKSAETLEAMKQAELLNRIRQTPLIERLDQARSMVGKMCSEGRPPKMTIPAQPYDEDMFICTTIRDAIGRLVH